MLESHVYTDDSDYVNSFKILAKKSKFRDIFSRNPENKDQEKVLKALEIKNLMREMSYQLIFFTEEKNLKETLSNMTNEENIWILLKFLFDKYQNYVFENSLRVDVVAQYNSIFEELIERIITLKLEDKIIDNDLEHLHELLDNEIFSKLFFIKLYEIIIGEERKIEYKLNHIFGGFFKILTHKFSEHKLEKTFYSFFLHKFFEKYDVLERAIINCNQFSSKKEKKDDNQSDFNELHDNNYKNISKIENVKMQIENILKYIYHESEKSNLSFICDCLVKFFNENRIVLIEERNRRSNQSRYNFINKRDFNQDISIEILAELDFNEMNAATKRKNLKEEIKSRIKDDELEDKTNEAQDQFEEEENKDLPEKRKSNRKASEHIISTKMLDKNQLSFENKKKTIKNKTDKFLKKKRLRAQKDDENDRLDKITIQENKIPIKRKDSVKKTLNKKFQNNNKITKRLNFEELHNTFESELKNNKSTKKEIIYNAKLKEKDNISNNFTKRSSSSRNTENNNSKSLEKKVTKKISPLKKPDLKKKTKTEHILNSNNITPVKSPKRDHYRESIKSADKLSYSPLIGKSKRGDKKTSFKNIQDSIRLKKSRSRSSSIHSNEKSEDYSINKTRHSPRIEKKSLDIKKINEKLKGFNISKNKKFNKSKIKPVKPSNRELNSLDKVDIFSNTPRDRTPEKFKSPLKNSALSENKPRELKSSSRKNSAKKERREKIKFGASIHIKEFDPKTPVKSLSYNLKNSPRLKNNLLNKKSNLKKPNLINERNEIRNSRSGSRTNSPLNSNKKRKQSQ